MSKKSVKKTSKPLNPIAAAERPAGKAYPAEPKDLTAQQQRVSKAAAAGAETLKSPSPAGAQPAVVSPAASAKPPTALLPLRSSPGRPPGDSKPAPRPVTAIAPEPPSVPVPPKTINVSFALVKPGARRVSLCGEFNRWSPEATPLKPHENGRWETSLALAPGRYQYKFVADGEWLSDPAAQQNIPNVHGTLNSVIEVRT
jgi:Glycogen recognition site of AMP-activated protein kinase